MIALHISVLSRPAAATRSRPEHVESLGLSPCPAPRAIVQEAGYMEVDDILDMDVEDIEDDFGFMKKPEKKRLLVTRAPRL